MPGQHAKTDVARCEIMHDVDQVAEIAPEPVELPDDERVAVAESLQACIEIRSVIELAARGVAVEITIGNAGANECVTLQIEHLRARRLC